MKNATIRYEVNTGRRNRYFSTIEGASAFCNEVARKFNIILSIVRVDSTR